MTPGISTLMLFFPGAGLVPGLQGVVKVMEGSAVLAGGSPAVETAADCSHLSD